MCGDTWNYQGTCSTWEYLWILEAGGGTWEYLGHLEARGGTWGSEASLLLLEMLQYFNSSYTPD